jgi:hypothetical protein
MRPGTAQVGIAWLHEQEDHEDTPMVSKKSLEWIGAPVYYYVPG